MALVGVGRVVGHRTSATIVSPISIPAPYLGRSRIARGIRLLRRHSQTNNVSARSSSARRRAIPDAHAPRVSDGTRTRDILDHNQVLYQLSYTHHAEARSCVADHTAQREVYRAASCRG
jgi:hypothetical protein